MTDDLIERMKEALCEHEKALFKLDDCTGCIWRQQVVVGFKERFECRRYPPTVTFLGAIFPHADRRCGEFSQKDTPND